MASNVVVLMLSLDEGVLCVSEGTLTSSSTSDSSSELKFEA